jgi:hypothetical protein
MGYGVDDASLGARPKITIARIPFQRRMLSGSSR